ncbi:MAG: UBA/THIF-type NAD/FAD binding protein [Halanaerobium sp. 4-GBenrich]|jgi:molybdopterin/thiamine biosynthesis adenylyltransferase|uniref:Molybdopterin/thiamine biosynthesis adenylyltransferase n=1 Tax=Halanaerobium congolense TaxID=54121 RepID=A0A1G6M4E5_9FIRM|nr:HesA/MoeB/ThiF family protein [Halanaerobium congolense]KXS47461.1 MAG: UBA/THIF-type NAD/FAD binding protein [Halanaerobium sp. T82-1]ODS50329.1 MAG: UBA/THIF-type NAD/FAD binding protein [Halanaerobium sp. 4-GBenrich]PXV65359.1 molybdopterin/thiamine biosynthesis adenylyltransferase [Halanaerobium congolense]TDP11608.1 molybdopterin/thiamine biosynthesis adenylyltransferase [Halanaerobium congolense]TDS34659.1 molybdopterin/thiamine biosynthesis adenylyltransferase [Halanaerobium congolen
MKDYLKRQEKLFSKAQRKRIEELNILIAGTGGLGTNQALQLQRIGVNKLYLYDYDRVEISNLNRQLCYGKKDLGRLKVEAAAEFLNDFDLETEIISRNEKITPAAEIPTEIDIIFDGMDNFESRFILDQLALENELPFIHAGIEGFFAQIMLVLPESKIRLKDVFAGPEKEETPAVFSPAVAVTASIQVLEALKYLLGFDSYLKNQLLHLDLLNSQMEKIDLN